MSDQIARYIIGIDLGTTNSSVAYVDTDVSSNPSLAVQHFRIPQSSVSGKTQASYVLPSFCYLHSDPDKLTGLNYTVGVYAKEEGSKIPTRLISSAKSWLCNSAASRNDKILPIECFADCAKVSPVEVSARFLRHIKEAWNNSFARTNPDAFFEEQDIVITVPASFDEVARNLTVEAAKAAGYVKMTLLEEPQAAFYSWIYSNEKKWESILKEGDRILVCDIGGGTSDFSLIDVSRKESNLTLSRMAVGDHLLLGGDNMDEALAHYFETKLHSQNVEELDSNQWNRLKHEARRVKESALVDDNKKITVVIEGSGSRLIGASLSFEIESKEIEEFLLKGFFGFYGFEEAKSIKKSSGIRTLGLPYEAEPSILKQLAHFLDKSGGKVPDFVLFNGGAMKPLKFQQAVVDSIAHWFSGSFPKVLTSHSLDLAVSRGAAYFGRVRRGLGVRIQGGTARSFYLGIDVKEANGKSTKKALTLLLRGAEGGSHYHPEMIFWLNPNTLVSFQLYSSHTRLNDIQGNLVEIEAEEMLLLPPIHTLLHYGKQDSQGKIPVNLEVILSEIGTLELSLKSLKSNHRWKLEFQLVSSSGDENNLNALQTPRSDETFESSTLEPAIECIREVYKLKILKPKDLMSKLELILGFTRDKWPISILRGLWDVFLEQACNRKLSVEYEARFWNSVGFILRPGFGYPLDDYRMKQLWKIILSDQGSKAQECQIQQWICFRRLAGGFSKGQQTQLASEVINQVLDKRNGSIILKSKAEAYVYSEKIRMIASMEFLDLSLKIKLGEALVQRLTSSEGLAAEAWALGRLGSRHLVYGSLANVIPPKVVQCWLEKLIQGSFNKDMIGFTIAQLSRKTNHREINLSQEMVDQAANLLASLGDGSLERLLHHNTDLSRNEIEEQIGDQLPLGLTLEI